MNEESRYQRAVHAVWERSLAAYQEWSGEQRPAVQSATDALLAWLRTCADEADLIPRYWEAGDALGGVLRKHLSDPITETVRDAGVALRPTGRRLAGRCPFHEGRDPSLVVYPDTASYFCFGSNAGAPHGHRVQVRTDL